MRRLFLTFLLVSCGPPPCDIPKDLTSLDVAREKYDKLSTLCAVGNVRATRYTLNTPLFSDYAEKERTIVLPKDTQATYDPEAAFGFPVGTFITKTFLTPAGKKLETRILTHTPDGWLPLPYVWDEKETEATLALGGASKPFDGNKYRVPNANQCEQCHIDKAPIGPTARSLKHDGFLESWKKLSGYDGNAVALARFDDTSAPLEDRARAWLEMNCAHCHQPMGSASNSGLDLRASETDPDRWGLCKRPVAAGMGSGGRALDIVPGKPDESIIVYRIESLEPNVMMPELGRSVRHDEGVALIREWIASMPGACLE